MIVALENSLQKTNAWINEVAELADCDAHQAYHGLRATLHALRDALDIPQIADLASQLPLVIRGIYYENWRPNQSAAKPVSRADFIKQMYIAFENDFDIDPERMLRSVFAVIRRHITQGEVSDVLSRLPDDLKELWQ